MSNTISPDDNDDPRNAPDGDLLRGAAAISKYVFGDPGQRRQIYHMHERNGFPAFKIGNTLFARRSTIQAWLTDKEK